LQPSRKPLASVNDTSDRHGVRGACLKKTGLIKMK
jgi:hypothetical protein